MDLKEFEERKKRILQREEGQPDTRNAELETRLNKIKKRVAVWSGKGGVGKTTVAIHLALALAEKEPTGLLDADIDCPNIPVALGLQEKLVAKEGKILPLTVEDFPNLQMVSMGSIIADSAVLWRGPMISSAITEFIWKVDWQVEQLVIDMPPGSSDAALTIAQTLRPHGFVIVTTSDLTGMADARRSIQFAKRLRLKIYGIVENMRGDIFGSGGGERLAEEFRVPFLGFLPMDKKIQAHTYGHMPLHKTEFAGVFQSILKAIETAKP